MPVAGFEPWNVRLHVECSTTVLPGAQPIVDGATTLIITTLSITTLSINDTQPNGSQYCYAEKREQAHHAECRYAQWRYGECRYAKCCGAFSAPRQLSILVISCQFGTN